MNLLKTFIFAEILMSFGKKGWGWEKGVFNGQKGCPMGQRCVYGTKGCLMGVPIQTKVCLIGQRDVHWDERCLIGQRGTCPLGRRVV